MSMVRAGFSMPRAGAVGRWLVLAAAAVYFFGPLLAAISFTVKSTGGGLTLAAHANIFASPGNDQPSILQALLF